VTLMSKLGDFGEVHEPLAEASFGFFGEDVRINPGMSELEFVDFMEAAADLDESNPAAMKMIKGLFRNLVHPEDFDVFWQAAKANRQTIGDLFGVWQKVTEALTARPTGQPADSSGGQSTTPVKSKGDSYSRALTLLEGRPDLQDVVVRKQEARLGA
jgi:hypothetical protein